MNDVCQALGAEKLTELYDTDEVAWLDRSVQLIRDGHVNELDLPHLAEFLEDMAASQRREVKSRLIVLLQHLLKLQHQPEKRSKSWEKTIRDQRRELLLLFETATLKRHGEAVLQDAYRSAVKDVVEETGLGKDRFSKGCPLTLDDILGSSSSEPVEG